MTNLFSSLFSTNLCACLEARQEPGVALAGCFTCQFMLFCLHLFVEETESLAVQPLSQSGFRLTDSVAISWPCISVAHTVRRWRLSRAWSSRFSVGPSQEDDAFRIRGTKLVIFYTQGMGGSSGFQGVSFHFCLFGDYDSEISVDAWTLFLQDLHGYWALLVGRTKILFKILRSKRYFYFQKWF